MGDLIYSAHTCCFVNVFNIMRRMSILITLVMLAENECKPSAREEFRRIIIIIILEEKNMSFISRNNNPQTGIIYNLIKFVKP